MVYQVILVRLAMWMVADRPPQLLKWFEGWRTSEL
jgi:hypothetical protein